MAEHVTSGDCTVGIRNNNLDMTIPEEYATVDFGLTLLNNKKNRVRSRLQVKFLKLLVSRLQ